MIVVGVAVAAVAVILITALVWGYGLGGLHPAGSGSSGTTTPPVEVRVSVLNLAFLPGNNSCFSSAYQSTHANTVVAGGRILYNVSLSDENTNAAHGCKVTGLSVNTSGFSISSSNAPVNVGTGSATLHFTLQTPTTAYNGTVSVFANVTFQSPDVKVTAQNFKVTGGGGQCGSVTASGTAFSGFNGSRYSDGALLTDISPAVVCNVTQVTLDNASGFSITGTNLPVQLPIDSFVSISFTLQLPSTSFKGILNYTLTLST